MSLSFYKTNSATYQTKRVLVDQLRGYPNGQAETSIPAKPMEKGGFCYLALPAEKVAEFSGLLNDPAITQITAAEYRAAFPVKAL
jgi:hypothetical protein